MAAPPISKENPDYQNSSPIKLLILILKKCSFASQVFLCRVSCVVLLMLIDAAAPVRRSGRTCRLTLLGAWVLVNAKALLKE